MYLYLPILIFISTIFSIEPNVVENSSDCLTEELYGDFTVEEYNNLVARRKLIRLKIKKENSALKVIGIEEIGKYLRGEINLTETKERIYIKTRQYAKRQTTWARGQMMSWQKLDPQDLNLALKKFK